MGAKDGARHNVHRGARVTQFRLLVITAVLCATVVAAAAFDLLRPIDDVLKNMRFALSSRPASGEIVFVEIDNAALTNIGSPSRARSLYAKVVDKLVADGASMIVLDVSLRGTLGFFDDNALADALTRAGGIVRTTASYPQGGGAGRQPDLPLERFAALAPPVFMGNLPDTDGIVRRYPTRAIQDGWVIESLATAVTPGRRIQDTSFIIDYGIDLNTIPRLAASRLLEQDAATPVEGRVVIVGSNGYSVQSGVPVPRYGMASGTAVQLLAAETVRQNRMLRDWRVDPPFVLVLLLAVAFLAFRSRMSLAPAIASAVGLLVLLEFAALALQMRSGVVISTVAPHISQLALFVAAVVQELGKRAQMIDSAARERDSMRGILARVVADNFDGVVVVDNSKTIRAASKLAEDFIAPGLRGRPIHDVLDEPFLIHLDAAIDHGRVMDKASEVTITRPNGDRIVEFVVTLSSVEEWEVSPGAAGRVACLTFRDVTERRQVEERLTYLARHDPLTGAASRMCFVEQTEEMLSSPLGRAQGAIVILVGLSRLKTVNDTLGHAYGDELLRQVVERLNRFGAVCVARLAGNSFGMLFKGLADDDMAAFAKAIQESISQPYEVAGHHAVVGASIGITDSKLSGVDPNIMVSHAAMALSGAQDNAGSAIVTFSKDMDARIKGKQDMETALRAALERGEFTVHYQPQVDLDNGEIIGVEALTRWAHPQLGNISPAEFIPAAEATGLIIELGRWVLETACREVATWPRPVRLSINVSPMQFEHGDIVSDIVRALEVSGLPAERLDIEITESLLVAEVTHVGEKLQLLRRRGVGVALDDFGTGYSSLSYLGRLPVDKIKIDQSFVRGLPEDVHATAIVRAVLMLAESLGKSVVAEGIETQDQAWLLRLAGCRLGQGYFFGRPVPATAMVERLYAEHKDAMPAANVG